MGVGFEQLAGTEHVLDRSQFLGHASTIQPGGQRGGDLGLAFLDLLGVDAEQRVRRVAEAGGDGDGS
ncbi:MAG TPA: hypothetical protein VGA13_08580 [Acidimicrobiales bacterium]|jgi:hypothetical protein